MNEIDLIIARLESIGSPVDEVLYYSETNVALATGICLRSALGIISFSENGGSLAMYI
jgi:hypothetical protein